MKLIKIITVIMFLLALANFAFAEQWYGTVTLVNSTAPDGTFIELLDYSTNTTIGSTYYYYGGGLPFFPVETYSAGTLSSSGQVFFRINGCDANEGIQTIGVNNNISCPICDDTTHLLNISSNILDCRGCQDKDGDGFNGTSSYCLTGTDCNDNNISVFTNMSGYSDLDNDGYGAGFLINSICTNGSLPLGYSAVNTDCDDTNSSIWANVSGYVDADSDGYGAGSLMTFCTAGALPSGYVTNNLDCDDTNLAVNPIATKTDCGTDWNCDGKMIACPRSSSGAGCTSAYTNCTAWTECSVAGTQTRDCTDAKRCTTSVKTETQSCTYVAPVVETPPQTETPPVETPPQTETGGNSASSNTTNAGVNVEQGTNTTTTTTTGSGNALTGQVIAGQGFKPTWWMSLLALFVVIGVLVGGYFFYKGRKDNEVIILK